MDTVIAPSNPLHDERQPHFSGEGEENLEKKPVLKKVKDKVKNIKSTIAKKALGHGKNGDIHQHGDLDEGSEGYEEVEEMEEDPAVHGGPIYGSSTADARSGQMEIDSGRRKEGGYENTAPGAKTGATEGVGGGGTEGEGVGLRAIKADFVVDPAAPNSSSGMEKRIGGEECAISPELHRSFNAMSVSDQTGGGEAEVPQKKNSSYTDKISAAKDSAVSIASESAELGKKVAAIVYDKASGAGTAVMGKMKPEAGEDRSKSEEGKHGSNEVAGKRDAGVSMKDYVVGKLSPGEEDKALSEVITEALMPVKGGAAEAGSPTPTPQKSSSGEGGGGLGVVGKIKETVTSYLGSGGSPRGQPTGEARLKDESNDFLGKTPDAMSQAKAAE